MPDPYKAWAEPLPVERMSVRHLSDDTRLLITPWGLMDLTMWRDGERIRGEAQVTATRPCTFETVRRAPSARLLQQPAGRRGDPGGAGQGVGAGTGPGAGEDAVRAPTRALD